MGKSTGEQEECPDQEEHEYSSSVNVVSGVLVESNGVVPAEEDEHGHQTVPRQFDDDVGNHEDLPAVGLCRSLSHFI